MNYNKTNYGLILQTAINHGFEFADFSTMDFSATTKKQIILRHDIDTSLAMALETAKIDAGYKIKATFALQLSSPLYNPFTVANIKIINEIHQLGHNIALHHRIALGHTTTEIKQGITREMQAMKIFFPYIQPVFIWHNLPPDNLLSNIEIPSMINAYNTNFTERMYYISDSVLKHKPEDFLAALKKHASIQMLLHPTIWMSRKDNIVSMLAYVLSNIIRECNFEFALNPLWKERFPRGVSQKTLSEMEDILSKPRYVQLLNPRSGRYVKIDHKLGIISHKKGKKPYKNIPIVSKNGK